MTALSISAPFPTFSDVDGDPLDSGYIYIGATNQNPVTNPITVYWDAALTVPAAQPIRTSGGYPQYNGTAANLYVNSDYSIRVTNKNGTLVYSAAAATARFSDVVVSGIDSSEVSYLPAGTGAVATTVQGKLRENVSVLDFGGSLSAALTAIGSTVTALHVTEQITLTANITIPANVILVIGAGGSINQSTYTVTFNGQLEAGRYQVFLGTGSVSGLKYVYPEWFGAVADGTTNNSPAWEYFKDMGIPILLDSGTYKFSAAVYVSNTYILKGMGKFSTNITTAAGIFIFVVETQDCMVSDITFDGGGSAVNSMAILHRGSVASVLKMDHCRVNNFGNGGIYIQDAIDCHFFDVQFYGGYAAMTPGTTTTRTSSAVQCVPDAAPITTTVSFEKCQFTSWKHAVNANNPMMYSYKDCIFEYNFIALYNWRDASIVGNASKWIRLDSCWFENNYHTSHGGGLFQADYDPTNPVTAAQYVLCTSIYQALSGRDALDGIYAYQPTVEAFVNI